MIETVDAEVEATAPMIPPTSCEVEEIAPVALDEAEIFKYVARAAA